MGGRGLVRAWGPSEELGRRGGGGRSLGSLDIWIVLLFPLLFCIVNSRGRQERRGLFSRSRAVHKAGWGWWGGVVCRREAVHASSADTFPVHSSRWEGRAEQAHV